MHYFSALFEVYFLARSFIFYAVKISLLRFIFRFLGNEFTFVFKAHFGFITKDKV